MCADFVRWLPQVSAAACRAARLQPGAGRSVLGKPIVLRDVAVLQPRRRVLVIGAIHGDEMSSAAMVLHWIALAGSDPAGMHWRFIPALNPDSLFRAQPQRTNARGVDLNRNFPTPGWERESRIYWEQRTHRDPRRFPGHAPLSEPESRYLHAEMEAFAPHLIVSVHAPYGVLDFDGPLVQPPRKLGSLHLDQVGIYPGSLGNYSGVHRGMPVVTIELRDARATPTDADMRQMWTDLLAWMDAHLPATPAPAPPPPPPAEPAAPAQEPEPPLPSPAPATPASAPAAAPAEAAVPEAAATPASSVPDTLPSKPPPHRP